MALLLAVAAGLTGHVVLIYQASLMLTLFAHLVIAVYAVVIARVTHVAGFHLVAFWAVAEAARRVWLFPISFSLVADPRLDEVIPLTATDILTGQILGTGLIWICAAGFVLKARALLQADADAERNHT